MKRHSLTAIVGTVQLLTMDALMHNCKDRRLNYYEKIRRAAVNEIIRLDGSPAPTEDVATTSTPGAVSDLMKEICGGLKP